MAAQQLTVSEALGWLKTLRARHAELVQLRNSSAAKQDVEYNGKITHTTPLYDARALDKQIATLAKDIRLCDTAIKRHNGRTRLEDYMADDVVLGELQ